MCGICGYVSLDASANVAEVTSRMNQIISHRGPDDEGYVLFSNNLIQQAGGADTPSEVWEKPGPSQPKTRISEITENPTIALGHRRLSIIDVSPLGHCPMVNDDSTMWITFNGEVYNYIELREELKELGFQFYSETDTEVVLKAYQAWGNSCVDKFNGMWAFTIYDVNKKQLFGSRDRFGVKPFYYFKSNKQFLFASEQKALLNSGAIPREINAKAVYNYLAFTHIEYEPQGFLEGIIELLPGHSFSLNVDDLDLQLWKYYDLPINKDYETISSEKSDNYVSEIKDALQNAVRLRMRSDVPIGACLSGGIDSSAIVCLMKDELGEANAVNTFTAGTEEKEIDETRWAQHVIDATSAKSNIVVPSSSELLQDLEELTLCQDVPLFSTSTYAQFRLMKKVKEQGVKVVLDGQGGDELFAGYAHHSIVSSLDHLKKGQMKSFKKEVRSMDVSGSNISFFFKQFAKMYGLKKLGNKALSYANKSVFKDYNYIDANLSRRFAKESFETYMSNMPSTLNGFMKYEFYNTTLKGYLKCEDRCSMWHSVEARTPFSDDHHLIEKVFDISGNYKIQNGIKKYLLREALKDTLPKAIYNRQDKMGYVTPNNKWISNIRNDVKDYFTEDLNEFINRDLLLKEYDTFFSPPHTPENHRQFKYMAFAIWKKVFEL